MELMRFCFKEYTPRDQTSKISLSNLIRQSTSRVGCFNPSLNNNGGNIVSCSKEDAKKCSSNSFNCLSGLVSWECTGKSQVSQEGAHISKLNSDESTQIVLCCAMTESSRSSSAYAGGSLGQRKDERVKKYPTQQESQTSKPVMLDVGIQAPDDSSECCDVLPLSSGYSSMSLKDETNINGDKCNKFSNKFHTTFNTEGCVKPPMDDVLKNSSAQIPKEFCIQSKEALFVKEAGNPGAVQQRKPHSLADEVGEKNLKFPQPGISQLVRQRLLMQCHSADNLLPSSVRSDSSQSTPEVPPRRKKRSSSHETMIGTRLRPLSVGCDTHHVKAISDEENKGEAEAAAVHFSASTENLARQSLLAAQLLHLIPARKARERNYLHGRIAANSLLGTVELERVLPSRSIQIFVGTWNMNGQAPPLELNDLLLPQDLEHVPDVMAFGTQESFPERFEWEVGIQETIGPSHVLLHSTGLGTLHLAVFVRRDLIWFCSVAEEASFSVRPGTAFRTKGAVAIAFMIFGTSFLFVTSHLTAHAEKVKERLSDVKKIIRSLDLPKNLPCRHKNKDVTQNFDCVFWCGDLNFRLSQPRQEVVDWVEKQQFPLLAPHKMDMDQLTNNILQGAVFRGFEEGPITFKPTYKYDTGTQIFDSSQKQRTPSYTDRILFKCRHTPRRSSSILGVLPVVSPSGTPFLECLKYSSVQSVCTSDHKPVWGLFRSHIRPGIDTIPLAAGLFNRDVYIEGINRRAAAMDKREGASTVCTIQ